MRMELCRVQTDDGLVLDGALISPDTTPRTLHQIDAFLLLHGTGSNFYSPGVLETFAAQAVNAGVPALRVNTRGHDGISSIPSVQGSVPGGATHEVIADCLHDVRAWLDFLIDRGFTNIALVGHSMGGVKSIYSQANDPHPSVPCIVGISPPRFCHAHWMSHPKADAFRASFRAAEEFVAAGQPHALLPVKQPTPFVATAGGYVAKYGPADDYDEIRYLPRVTCPTLMIVGTQSVATSPAFDGLPAAVREVAARNTLVSLQLVEDANVNYSNQQQEPFERMRAWLDRL